MAKGKGQKLNFTPLINIKICFFLSRQIVITNKTCFLFTLAILQTPDTTIFTLVSARLFCFESVHNSFSFNHCDFPSSNNHTFLDSFFSTVASSSPSRFPLTLDYRAFSTNHHPSFVFYHGYLLPIIIDFPFKPPHTYILCVFNPFSYKR